MRTSRDHLLHRWSKAVVCAALAWMLSLPFCFSQSANVTVNPEADAFVRAVDPASNYGAAGAIAVSGATAVNALNQQNGAFDSLFRFSMSNVVASLDSALGTHDWLVLRAILKLTEIGAPFSSDFNRGVGLFEIRCLASNSWIEGTGNRGTPTTDGVSWNDLSSLLSPAADTSLGRCSNSGTDSRLSFVLSLTDSLVSDIRAGGRVTLYLTAVSPQIGFTADSRSNLNSNDIPALEILAAANPDPRIDAIESLASKAVISFKTVSNWTYVVQVAEGLTGAWSNLVTLPAQETNSEVVVSDARMSGQRFYRLAVTR